MTKKQNNEQIRRMRELSLQSLKEHRNALKYTPYVKDAAGQYNTVEDPKKAFIEEKKKQSDKVTNYAKYVKEMYWP